MSDQTTPKKTVKLWVICYLVLLVNSSYLAGYADPTLFYFGNVALHLILGVVLTIAFAIYAFRRFGQFSRTMKLAVVLLAVGAALGLFMMKFGATRQYRWALYSHIAFAVAGSIPLLLVLARGARNYPASRRRSLVYVAIVSLIFVFPIASTAYNRYASQARNRIVNPDNVPLSMGGPARNAPVVTRKSTISSTPRRITSDRSTTSGTENQSSICKTSSARSRRSGAPDVTITPCSSTAGSIVPSRNRLTHRKRKTDWAARLAIR